MSEVRLITPITRQSTKKMQVAAYCRVSSNSADQLNSYAAQIRAYKKLIGERDDWELVDIFADEGLTGMKSETRDEFQRMIRMCELKQIDLIITKSISRFARNTKDALAYVRKLKLLGVGVQFEKEGISTLFMGDEMLLNTFSALAQEESQSISMNQRLSIVKRMELGEYVDSNAPYGYRLVDKMLAVYEPEAVIVRNIFTLYLQGFSTSEIARELNKLNIPTKSGKETWRPSRVAYVKKRLRPTFTTARTMMRSDISAMQIFTPITAWMPFSPERMIGTSAPRGSTLSSEGSIISTRRSRPASSAATALFPLTPIRSSKGWIASFRESGWSRSASAEKRA